jgi:hypothetical protein
MSSDHVKATGLAWLERRPDGKGHESGMLDGIVVLAPRLNASSQRRTARQTLKARGLEALNGVVNGVKWIRRSSQKSRGLFRQGDVRRLGELGNHGDDDGAKGAKSNKESL